MSVVCAQEEERGDTPQSDGVVLSWDRAGVFALSTVGTIMFVGLTRKINRRFVEKTSPRPLG